MQENEFDTFHYKKMSLILFIARKWVWYFSLQENEFDTFFIARKWVWFFNLTYGRKWYFEIRFQYWHCAKRYHKYCKPLLKFRSETNYYFWFDTYTRLNSSFIYQLHNSIKVLCQKQGYRFIDNSNISCANLWQDGLHLNSSGILRKNYAKW